MSTTIPLVWSDSGNLAALETADDSARFGNKAANLARVMATGIRVPPGMVCSTEAFELFLDANQLQPVIEPAMGNSSDHTQTAHTILEAFLAAPLPEALITPLRLLEPNLAAGPWVVRSSACGEDSGQAAFPGMLDSILHVRSLPALHDALRRCWASCWSARCLAYRADRGVDPGGMGVIIQQQVPAVLSGVTFSQSPLAGAEDQMLVEYCPGLADELVSGRVTPGSISIARDTGAWTSLSAGEDTTTGLNDTAVADLRAAALALEQLFAHPQDIEWSFDAEGRLFVLQSRPITAMQPPGNPTDGHILYSCANINENYPEPVSPMLFDIARQGYYHYFRNLGLRLGISRRRVLTMEPVLNELVARHAGRMYYDLSGIHSLLRMAPAGEFLARAFDTFTGASGKTEADPALSWRGFDGSRLRLAGELFRIGTHTSYHLLQLRAGVRNFEHRADAFARETAEERLKQKSAAALIADLQQFVDIRCHHWFYPSLADASSMISYGLLKRALQRAFPEAEGGSMQNRLLQGLQDVVSAAPAVRLWELSRRIRDDAELHALFAHSESDAIWQALQNDARWAALQADLQAYLAAYGFRRSGELMLTRPSFQEDPLALIDILRAYAEQEGTAEEARWQHQQDHGDEQSREVLDQLTGSLPTRWARRCTLRVLIRWTRRSISLRERARHKQALLYSRVRRVALTLGARMQTENVLPAADAVFMRSIAEWAAFVHHPSPAGAEVRQEVVARQAEHETWCTQLPPESLALRPGETWRPQQEAPKDYTAEGNQLIGTAASSGIAEGPAAVLYDISEFGKLSDGAVLVAAQTDPGWGPAFFRIVGLVIERGGMLSHGAILAREYGIPTVVGVTDATQRIPHGKTLTVDGDRGVVTRHD